jgi:uncharacterized membrane protein
MVIAALRDNAYDVVLVLHILSVIIAFAPASTSPTLAARIKKAEGEQAVVRLSTHLAANAKTLHFPALVLAGVFGGALIGMSDEAWKFSQTWIWLAIVVWLAICGIVSAVLMPAERALAAGDLAAEKKVALGGQLAAVLLLVMLYLMIFKPGG